MANPPIFDGHNDTLTRIHKESLENPARSFFTASAEGDGHIELPKAIAGGLSGGFFAIFTSNPPEDNLKIDIPDNGRNGYMVDLPPPISHDYGLSFVLQMIELLRQWEIHSAGKLKIVYSSNEFKSALEADQMAAILHIEGAEAVKSDLSNLEELYGLGLRSIGPVWSRPNDFGHGVPFAFPASPNTGPGLTAAGKALVRECNRMGIMLDVSHLNEKGFWDLANHTDAPIIATHCGVWNLCRCTRNLTDKQLDAIAESNGLTGINFCKNFLRKDGMHNQVTSLELIVDHLRYIVDRNGIDHVAFGSDFDGAQMPNDLTDASQLPKLIDALRVAGFHEHEIEQVCWKNWYRVLCDTF